MFNFRTLFTIALMTLMASSVHALPLQPGGVLTGTDLQVPSFPHGSWLEFRGSNVVAPGSFEGFVASYVYRLADNPFHRLTFVYRIINEHASRNSIGRVSISGFSKYEVDVEYFNDADVVIAPGIVSRDPSGDIVGFNFIPVDSNPRAGFLAPSTTASFLLIHTNANKYKIANAASLIDGGGVTVDALVPVSEPSSLLLAAGPLVGLFGARFCSPKLRLKLLRM